MVTSTVSHQQYRESVAQANLSTADKVSRLTVGNERLDSHRWTDDQLKAIPHELLTYAWQQSAALRAEFRGIDIFLAYWRQLQRKK